MSFESKANCNLDATTNAEVEQRLDINHVRDHMVAVEPFRTRESHIDIQARLSENERICQEIKTSCVDVFKNLPTASREHIVSSIPAHWTGSEYPLYDLIRAAHC